MKPHFVDLSKLELEVYTIGYYDKGESQIVILFDRENDRVLMSSVIDCYSHNEINKTIEILNDNNIDSLDHFIWTHTDEDHSIGIGGILDSFCSETTSFFLPEGVEGQKTDFIDYSAEAKTTFERINNFNQNRNYNVHSASVVTGLSSPLYQRVYIDKNSKKELIFKISAIAPLSSLVRRKNNANSVVNKNDLSIATLYSVGELALLFAGDIEDQTIRQIPSHFFNNLSFVKTPHHTSTSSSVLLDKIDQNNYPNKIPSAVTTTYNQHSLPDNGLINEYKKYVDSFKSTGRGENQFGYIKSVFKILEMKLKEFEYGDACSH